jgi:DNA-binding response OmpR family regulator
MSQGEKKQIGKILLEQRAVSPAQLEQALAERAVGGRLASRLAAQGIVSEVEALKALSEQHGIPGVDLGQICLRLEDLEVLPREIAEKHLILPVLVREDRVLVAMANPRERKVIEELEFVTGKRVYPYVALDAVLREVIEAAYSRKIRGETHYIGPRCPPDVLERAGIDPAGLPLRDPELPLGKRCDQPGPLGDPTERATVVDDTVGRVSRSDEVEDSDFGAVSRELSVVTDLPKDDGVPVTASDAKTILVVDDEADIRRLLKRLLTARGFRVLEADRGLLALRMVKEHMPDLIVLDAMLPEVHGFEIARRIKGSARYGKIPIVMVSAVYRGWRYAEDLKSTCGVDHYLEKPFRIAEVMRAVEDCLRFGQEGKPGQARDISQEAEEALNDGVAAYRAGRLDEAVEHLRRGIGVDPLAYRLHYHLGLLYGKRGQVYEAISELETALEINGRHFAAVKNLAVLYQKAGFRYKAVEMWQRALSLAPDEPTRQSIRQHLLPLL